MSRSRRSPNALYTTLPGEFCPAPNLECFVQLKSGEKEECLDTHQGQERTFQSFNWMIEGAESISIHKVSVDFLLRETSLLPHQLE